MQLDRASFTLQSYTNLILLPMVLLQKNTKLQTGALKFFLKIGIKVILNLCCSLITYHLMYYFEKKNYTKRCAAKNSTVYIKSFFQFPLLFVLNRRKVKSMKY